MESLISEKEINKFVDEFIEEYLTSLNEAPIPGQVPVPKKVVKQQQPIRKAPVPVKNVPVEKPVVQKPTSQTIPGPKDKPEPEIKKGYDPELAKQKQTLSKVGYQIFNIKMRLGKLGLNDTVRRFAQSIHDFDINVTKNSADSNDIQSYLAPAKGNLIALKGALESLEAEFNELEKILEEK